MLAVKMGNGVVLHEPYDSCAEMAFNTATTTMIPRLLILATQLLRKDWPSLGGCNETA